MAKTEQVFCGIDVGTQGARCVLVTRQGEVVGDGESSFHTPAVKGLPEGWFEQEPEDWLRATATAVCGAVGKLKSPDRTLQVGAVGVTSTSGTLCAVGDGGRPLGRAVMYNDSRSKAQAQAVQAAGAALAASLGYRFNASFGLPKILWLKNHSPDLFAEARHFISPTDFIIGWLTGDWGRTDQTNALKFGYDLLDDRWPEFIEGDLGIPLEKMPRVQTSGQKAGKLSPERALELGLPARTPVAAGLTDGCASQISSGAVAPGDFNTTIGTTLVVKGVTEKLLLDPKGRVYCHRHPDGWWLPGGASNTGAECIAVEFDPGERERLSSVALAHSPSGLLAYPLVGRGERFPFSHAGAEAFLIGKAGSREELFVACLEGVACLERLAFEVVEELGARVGDLIYSAGGGAQNEAWLQIRADTLNRTVLRPAVVGGAMGAAITGAVMCGFNTITQAARQMVRIERATTPRADMIAAYNDKYARFREECRRRGYLSRA